MTVWISNKAEFAWLIDPIEKLSYIFRPDGSIELIQGFEKNIKGEKPVEGFEPDLELLR